MSTDQEKIEREKRAGRLAEARVRSGLGGVRKVCGIFNWNENNYKAHESGRNGFKLVDARKYARAFKVSVQWLYLGLGQPDDDDREPAPVRDIPLISWVSAGALTDQMPVEFIENYPTIAIADLPDGDWYALRVTGNSMNKISPHDSIVIFNLRDKRLAPGASYILADETGDATYKRYQPNEEPPFQPFSFDEVAPPVFQGAVNVIGRVRRTIIEM